MIGYYTMYEKWDFADGDTIMDNSPKKEVIQWLKNELSDVVKYLKEFPASETNFVEIHVGEYWGNNEDGYELNEPRDRVAVRSAEEFIENWSPKYRPMLYKELKRITQ